MKTYANHVIRCLYCRGNHIQKNGQLPQGGQRFRCVDCSKHFTLGGTARGTYDETFKASIIKTYCHDGVGARDVAKKFHISTSTLIQWAKKHREKCVACNKY